MLGAGVVLVVIALVVDRATELSVEHSKSKVAPAMNHATTQQVEEIAADRELTADERGEADQREDRCLRWSRRVPGTFGAGGW